MKFVPVRLLGIFLLLLMLGSSGLVMAEGGKTVTIALGTEPTDLNPIINTGHADFFDIIKVYSGLVKSDDSLQMTSDLAKTWEQPDANTFIFHLRDGVKWQDGTAFSSDDVKFTFDLLKSGKWLTVFPSSSEYDLITNIETPDKDTVKFTVSNAPVSFIERFALPILPKHLLEGQDLASTEFWQKPVGTGPYVFDHWNKGEELVLTANKDYYNGAPKIQTLKFVMVPDESARVNLLKTGEVQAIKIGQKTTASLKDQTGIKVISSPSANWYSINMPYVLPQFKDTAVHQAVALAIDKQGILDTIFAGQGELAYGPFRSQDWVYNKDVEFSQDIEKAKKILADAGWKAGSDGVLEKDGVKLEFDLIYVATNSERKDIAIAVSSDLDKIGIKANPTAKANWDELNYQVFHTNAVVTAEGSPFDPDDQSYKIYGTKYINDGWWNPASYSNPELDKLFEQGRTTSDKSQRKQIYGQIQKILADDQPMPPIVFGNYVYAVSDKISGVVPRNGPHGGGNTGSINGDLWWNAENWDLSG
ncbi:MAG TPA: ABC transporter substrate-binding protein [Methanospirillum sp.]|nr:ABC transporter substrate-binding protein [Methanospirillum sp.]